MISHVLAAVDAPCAALDMKKAPERLTAMTLCQSSSVSLNTVLSDQIAAPMPRVPPVTIATPPLSFSPANSIAG